MGNMISRIEREFIVKALDDNKFSVRVHGTRKQTDAVILSYEDEKYIDVFSKERDFSEFRKGEAVRIFFTYYGHVMTFNSKIIECDEEKARLTYPVQVLKNLQRKYERVQPPEGIDLTFKIDNVKVVLSFPESETFVRLEDYSKEDKYDTSDLNSLIDEFREIISSHCDNNKIIMFRDKKPETFEEKLVSRTGRVFYMQSIYEGFSFPESANSVPVIDKEDLSPENMEELLSDIKKRKLYSVIYCPILYHEYTVGYIYLSNERNKKIKPETLDYVYQFSKILAWVLDRNNYFSGGKTVSQEFRSEIVDISASGLLFADNSESLHDALNIYTDLDLELRIGQRRMNVFSRVMRKYPNRGMTFYGVQFMEMNPEDFRYLFEYVYGRMFTEDDSTLWEGGSSPPTLEL